MQDPVYDAIVKQLRAIRRASGLPTVERISGHQELIEALGFGDVERAWARLERLRDEYGSEPATDTGAYFYLAGWDVGRETLAQRISVYANEFACDERTALRRGDRGMRKVATIVRDLAETNRPWGLMTIFQSGAMVDVIVRLMLAYESWRPATIEVNGEEISDPRFTVHPNPDVVCGYYHQAIAEAVPLDLDAGLNATMASVFVHWPMPVWPTWQTASYIADPRIIVRTRTYRDRGVELRLEWSGEVTPRSTEPLKTDQRLWVARGKTKRSTPRRAPEE